MPFIRNLYLYGHSHGNLEDLATDLSLDVGVDCWNFAPVSYEEIKKKMSEKTPKELTLR
jgi:calcineurin-like phosphoesterase family protein